MSARAREGASARPGDEFRELLAPGAIRAVYQPIVRLGDLETIGYEGLARFPTPPGLVALPPDVTLAAAARSGLRGDLEVACWAAIAEGGSPPDGRLLFVNVSPELIGHAGLAALGDRLPARLVIELTEQDAVRIGSGARVQCADATRSGQPPDALRERLRWWTARGALIAIDDAGSGFTALEYVAEIRPDFLKLCRGMVTGVDLDGARQAVLRATVAFAREVGARVIAEGVERREELEVLRAAGVDYGQGWLFGRPGPAWPSECPERPALRALEAPRRPAGKLAQALEAAPTVREACAAVAGHLARRGLLPSVYLEQGGRLRCQAAQGYWQIYDGMPPAAGLIGRAFRAGEPVVVRDAADVPGFLPSIPAVSAQACLPLAAGDGAVVGVLSAESPTTLGDAELAELAHATTLLSARIAALGGVEDGSPAQRLARTLAALAALDDPEDIVRETVTAACELSGLESALLALSDDGGSLYPHHAEGSFAVALGELDAGELARIAAWVDHGTSCYTIGDAAGRGFAGHEPLRRAGASSMLVLPMVAGGERVGMLVLADRRIRPLTTEAVELLELLAVQAAGGLRVAAAVLELRERAARDPLTGLGHHASFHAALPAMRAAGACALVLTDLDHFKAINDSRGHAAGDAVLRAAAGLLRAAAPAGGRAFRIGGDEFAIVFACADEEDARRTGWELRSRARERLGTTLSVGIALADPGETDEQLVARADAALYAVKRRGRDGILVAPRPAVR